MKNIITDGGALGDGVTDDTSAIQTALNLGGNWYFPEGTYLVSSTLQLTKPATRLIGANMATSSIKYIGTGICLQSANPDISLLWCGIEHLQFLAPNITLGYVLNLQSMQFTNIKNVWIHGSSNSGCTGINLAATWGVTEATYNTIENCYIGGVFNGVTLLDGANNNSLINTRIQPPILNGSGVVLLGSSTGRVSCNTIFHCSFEYPGNISNGIIVGTGTNGTFLYGNRFEALKKGISVASSAVNCVDSGQYYSGCTINKGTP